MDPQPAFTFPAFTFQALSAHVIGDMTQAVSGRGDDAQHQLVRSQAAAHMILGFLPRDLPEAMLAGHCVMLHEVLIANIRTALDGDAEPTRRGPDGSVVALNKAFNDTLGRLERYQRRPAGAGGDMPDQHAKSTAALVAPVPPQAQTPAPMVNRAARRQAARTESKAAAAAFRPGLASGMAPPAESVSLHTTNVAAPSLEAIAACKDNPDAMMALKSGDAAGFARALGVAHPSAAFLAAATAAGSPFIPAAPLRASSAAA